MQPVATVSNPFPVFLSVGNRHPYNHPPVRARIVRFLEGLGERPLFGLLRKQANRRTGYAVEPGPGGQVVRDDLIAHPRLPEPPEMARDRVGSLGLVGSAPKKSAI